MKWLYVFFVFFILGCSQEDGVTTKKGVEYGCLVGNLPIMTLADQSANTDLEIEIGKKLAFSPECKDLSTDVDPFTNPYRRKDGLNLVLCGAGWSACQGDEEQGERVYMTISVDIKSVSLGSPIRVGRSKEFVGKGSGTDIFKYNRKLKNGDSADTIFQVHEDGDFVARCFKYSRGSCLLVGFDKENKMSYSLAFPAFKDLDWMVVHEKALRFINQSIVLVEKNNDGGKGG